MSRFMSLSFAFFFMACNNVSSEDYRILEARVKHLEGMRTDSSAVSQDEIGKPKKDPAAKITTIEVLDKVLYDHERRMVDLEGVVDYLQRDRNRHHLVELLYFDPILENHGSGIYQVVGEKGNKLRKLDKLGSTFPDVIVTIQELSHVKGLAQQYNSECVYYLDVWQTNETGVRWLKSATLVYPTFPSPCIAEEDLQVHKEIFTNQQILKPASPFEELER